VSLRFLAYGSVLCKPSQTKACPAERMLLVYKYKNRITHVTFSQLLHVFREVHARHVDILHLADLDLSLLLLLRSSFHPIAHCLGGDLQSLSLHSLGQANFVRNL
jgi:hypothetical protein